jgi:hypothetical protein
MIIEDADLAQAVKQELIAGWHAEAALAEARQRRIAQANARLEQAHIEGVGQKVMSVDLFTWLDWNRRFPGITGDSDWRKTMLRDHPELRVKYTPRTTTVRVDGWKDEVRRKKDEVKAAPQGGGLIVEATR